MTEYKHLTTHHDERGFFREIIRQTDQIFNDGLFGQLSHSMKHADYYTPEFHYHRYQTDWWYVPVGMIRIVLCTLVDHPEKIVERVGNYTTLLSTHETVVKIPPMTAHGFKVLDGPAHLLYMTSQVYNPEDEGRIVLDYNWLK